MSTGLSGRCFNSLGSVPLRSGELARQLWTAVQASKEAEGGGQEAGEVSPRGGGSSTSDSRCGLWNAALKAHVAVLGNELVQHPSADEDDPAEAFAGGARRWPEQFAIVVVKVDLPLVCRQQARLHGARERAREVAHEDREVQKRLGLLHGVSDVHDVVSLCFPVRHLARGNAYPRFQHRACSGYLQRRDKWVGQQR